MRQERSHSPAVGRWAMRSVGCSHFCFKKSGTSRGSVRLGFWQLTVILLLTFQSIVYPYGDAN